MSEKQHIFRTGKQSITLPRYLTLIILCALPFLMGGCVAETEQDMGSYVTTAKQYKQNPIVTIIMDDDSVIKMELYADKAPVTVTNFVGLVQDGFYNGIVFHRIYPGFMIQGGDPKGNGLGGPGYSIFGEFEENGFQNDLPHKRGTVSMARQSNNMNSAGSQFFIVVADSTHLDNSYASFGKVIEGMDVVDKIVSGPADGDRALEPRVMKEVTVLAEELPQAEGAE